MHGIKHVGMVSSRHAKNQAAMHSIKQACIVSSRYAWYQSGMHGITQAYACYQLGMHGIKHLCIVSSRYAWYQCCLRLGRERFFFILLVIFLSCLLFIFVVFLPGS